MAEMTILIAPLCSGSQVSAAEPPTQSIPAHPVPAPGQPAPLFSAAKFNGGALSLQSLRGHVVLLNFWSSACPPCRIEMPELEKIQRRHAGRGLRVIGVTEMDPPRDQVRDFLERTGVTYPVLLDPGGRIGSLYALEAHPTSIVIDARGIVRYTNVGFLKGEEKEIERAVVEALRTAGGRRGQAGAPGAGEGKP